MTCRVGSECVTYGFPCRSVRVGSKNLEACAPDLGHDPVTVCVYRALSDHYVTWITRAAYGTGFIEQTGAYEAVVVRWHKVESRLLDVRYAFCTPPFSSLRSRSARVERNWNRDLRRISAASITPVSPKTSAKHPSRKVFA